MPYQYYFDEEHIREWMDRSKSACGADEYLQEYIYGVDDFYAYLELIGGVRKLQHLKLVEQLRANERV